jgi:hypothetical protein
MADRNRDDLLYIAILALLAEGFVEDDPIVYDILREFRRKGSLAELSGPDIESLLLRAMRRPRRRLANEVGEALSEGFSRLDAATERRRAEESYIGAVVHRLEEQQQQTARLLDETRQFSHAVAGELYDLTWLLSVGVDISSARLTRHVPARIFFADGASFETRSELIRALRALLQESGLEFYHDLPDQEGSWWKRLFFRTKTALSQEEVQKRLKKAERAVEAHYLAKPEAEANSLQASAAANLINSLGTTENAAIQVGSLLIIKVTNEAGKSVVLARTLTPEELRHIEENQSILRQPDKILELLQSNQQLNHSLGDTASG